MRATCLNGFLNLLLHLKKRRKSRFLTHSKPGTSSPSTNSFPKYFLARTPHEVTPEGGKMFEWFAKPSPPPEKQGKSRFLTHPKPGTSSPSTNSFPKYFLARTPHE